MDRRTLVAGIAALLAACGTAQTPPPIVEIAAPTATIAAPIDPPPPPVVRRAAPGRRGNSPVIESVAGLHVGDTLAQVEAIAGPAQSSERYEEERRAWESSGFDISAEPLFAIGFDEAVTFREDRVPLFKTLMQNGRVRVLIFSANSGEGSHIGVEPSCFLGSSPSDVVATLGSDFTEIQVDPNEQIYDYVSRGVRIIFQDKKVQVIDVYGYLGPGEQAGVEAAIDVAKRKGPRP